MDARVERTRRRLQEALFDLARERDVDSIAISDIAERAGVNRSTFYQHYADKETVLADALDAMTVSASASLDADLVLTAGPPDALLTFMRHIEANAAVYRRIFWGAGTGLALARMRGHIERAIHVVALAARRDRALPAPVEVIAAGVAGSMVGVIGAWLEMEPLPPARQAAEWAWDIVLGPQPDVRHPA